MTTGFSGVSVLLLILRAVEKLNQLIFLSNLISAHILAKKPQNKQLNKQIKYITMNYQLKVKEFQLASGQPVSDTPRKLTKEEYDFRDSLLREEIKELQYAIVDNNRVEILDALCDIKYVNDGTANQMGKVNEEVNKDTFHISSIVKDTNDLVDGFFCLDIDATEIINSLVLIIGANMGFTLENFLTALDRVHSSNMSKFCLDTKTAERTQEFYSKQGINTYVEPREKKFVVYREGDGKVLKSVEFYPVYLEDLV